MYISGTDNLIIRPKFADLIGLKAAKYFRVDSLSWGASPHTNYYPTSSQKAFHPLHAANDGGVDVNSSRPGPSADDPSRNWG